MLYGATAHIGGKEVTVTHKNPETGEVWIEPDGEWVAGDKVDFS